MNEEAQLLATGRIIAATRNIESKLVECGASGSGLREKTESLGSRLPVETVRLINHIGTVRNRVAHENNVELRDDELELFEEASATVLTELEKLLPEPKKAVRKKPAAPKSPTDEPAEPETTTKTPAEKALPPWNSPMWAYFPGVHLAYAFLTGWSAFGAGQLYLLLLLAELLSLTALGFAAALPSVPLAITGGSLFVAIWLCGAFLGWRGRAEYKLGFCLFPLLNLFWFIRKVIDFIDPARLVISIAILGTWLAAIQLAASGEFPAAAIVGAISWIGALIDAILHKR